LVVDELKEKTNKRVLWIVGLLLLFTMFTLNVAAEETQDHSEFSFLEGPFETGPEVTSMCITGHIDVPSGIMKSVHWTRENENPITGDELGKNNVINNFCVSLTSNEPRCTRCHIARATLKTGH